MSHAEIERRKNRLLESLSLYEEHCGARGGESILRRVKELQVSVAESMVVDELSIRTDMDPNVPAYAA